MENKYGLNKDIYNEIIETFKSISEIKRVVLYGSRARGDYKKTSDIDLAVTFEEDKKLLLIRKLDDLKCILKFDVINIDMIQNEKLLENIKNEGEIIYIKK